MNQIQQSREEIEIKSNLEVIEAIAHCVKAIEKVDSYRRVHVINGITAVFDISYGLRTKAT